MHIQVHWPKLNDDGSRRSQTGDGTIPPEKSPSFIGIGWCWWLWASSQFSSNNVFLQIQRLTCFWWVFTIFEIWSLNTYLDDSPWCFRGWLRASWLLFRQSADTVQWMTLTAASHPTQYRGGVKSNHHTIGVFSKRGYIYHIPSSNHAHCLLIIVSWEYDVSFVITAITTIGLILNI